MATEELDVVSILWLANLVLIQGEAIGSYVEIQLYLFLASIICVI